MASLRVLLCLVALFAAVVFTSPTPQKRSFTHRVRRSIDTTHPAAGMNAMLKASRKYGWPLISRQTANTTSAVTGKAGTVGASPEPNNAEYLEQVGIGNQKVTLDFDTGSSDLYVYPGLLTLCT